MNIDTTVREHVLNLLRGGGAHIRVKDALRNFPEKLRGKKADGAPHTAWQLLEHMRIAQWDILEFSRNAAHQSPKFPEGYWPASEAPPGDKDWDASVKRFEEDLESMQRLVEDASIDLYVPIPHGDGQTVLREALLVADHNAYHLGQLVLVRRLLGAWND
jgi:hypothetical protein